MDISAVKINVNSVSTSTPSPVVKTSSDSQVASVYNKSELAVQSEVNPSNTKAVKLEDVQQMTAAMNHFLQVSNADMQVTLHDKTNQLMVRFVDTKSGQLLKEFPSHEFLDTMAHIREYVGILLDKKI